MKNYLKKSKLFKKLEIWNEYRNPFYIWWKCRKYFKFPNIKIHTGGLTWFFGYWGKTNDGVKDLATWEAMLDYLYY